MHRARPKPPRIRVVKRKPKPSNVKPTQIYDEDVLRWRRMFTDEEAIVAARLAGSGSPGLATCPSPPVLSPEAATSTLQYVNTLQEDARHAIFKHCGMIARHERMLLEGQERLKYVQAQIREMKARLPPPPPPRPREPSERGPDVTVDPIPEPTCWASCCGLFPPPPPPPPSPPPPALPRQLIIQLPGPSYFEEAARKEVAVRRMLMEQQQQQQQQQDAAAATTTTSNGGGATPAAASGPTPVEPVPLSIGGAVEAAASPPSVPMAAAAANVISGTVDVVQAAELPGQLDTQSTSPPPPPAALPLPPAAPLAPLLGRAPGAPQSLLRSLAPLPLLARPNGIGGGGGDSRSAAAAEHGPAARRAAALHPLRAPPSKVGEGAVPPPPAVITSAAAAATATAATAASASTPAAPLRGEPVGTEPSAIYDLTRYQNPESIKKITRIQAVQRGRIARRQVAGMREQQRQQQQSQAHGLSLPLPPVETASAAHAGQPVADGRTTATAAAAATKPIDLTPSSAPEDFAGPGTAAAAAAAAPLPHPFVNPAHGTRLPLLLPLPSIKAVGGVSAATAVTTAADLTASANPAANVGGAAADAPLYDLTRYQNPESIKKITRIQAVQRGRIARRQVAGMREQQKRHDNGGDGADGSPIEPTSAGEAAWGTMEVAASSAGG